MPGPVEVRARSAAVDRLEHAVEQQLLDPDVVVEVLEVHAAARARSAGCRWIAGPQCSESGSCAPGTAPPTRRSSVIPPQRVTSAWSTSTAPASSIRSK